MRSDIKMVRQQRDGQKLKPSPKSRRTTEGGGNTRFQEKYHMARMQTQWEFSCQIVTLEDGWLVQTGTKKEPQPDLYQEERIEERHPGFPITHITEFSKTASHRLKICRYQKAREHGMDHFLQYRKASKMDK